jgi:hypothetical protein
MDATYLVRYGLMAHIGRFAADASDFARGQVVVVRSHRGTELGEVLTPASPSVTTSRVLRAALPDDLECARLAALDRPRRLEACERVFRDGVWPLDLLDVEPLLEERRTVLYYLGPHGLDAEGLQQILRETCGLDATFEPLGRDESEEAGCGSCGTGSGCGSCTDGHAGGCSGCPVKDLIAERVSG